MPDHFIDFTKVTCTPPHDIIGKEVSLYLPKGEGAEELIRLMEISKKIFRNHPVNLRRQFHV